MTITPEQRARHLEWLKEITQIPTAAGREYRVIRWIERWCGERGVSLTRDAAGNLHIEALAGRRDGEGRRPVYFTAHLDHPAFVVERVVGPGTLQLSFRGGVMDDYFKDARVRVWNSREESLGATLRGEVKDGGGVANVGSAVFKHYLAELDDASTGGRTPEFSVNDVAVWDVAAAEVIDGNVHTLACDDLAALAAALAAFDVLLGGKAGRSGDMPRLLFTRAEEIGFVGAIAAVRGGTMAKHARVIALENSRSFADSPIGGGPIVRVGDRISIFSPTLTDAIASRAEEIGGPSTPMASQKAVERATWPWQRKLMAGGACEASVFCHAGYEATCVCLPLGNYHNMGDLANVQAGTNTTGAKIEREYIALKDFEGLVDLLVACGERLDEGGKLGERFEKLWAERGWVVGS
jgi:putative aminopeptidase FrvX